MLSLRGRPAFQEDDRTPNAFHVYEHVIHLTTFPWTSHSTPTTLGAALRNQRNV